MAYTCKEISFRSEKEVLTCVPMCMNLADILSERSQTQEVLLVQFLSYEVPRIEKFIETESEIDVTRG